MDGPTIFDPETEHFTRPAWDSIWNDPDTPWQATVVSSSQGRAFWLENDGHAIMIWQCPGNIIIGYEFHAEAALAIQHLLTGRMLWESVNGIISKTAARENHPGG